MVVSLRDPQSRRRRQRDTDSHRRTRRSVRRVEQTFDIASSSTAVMWTWNLQQNLPDGSSYLNFRDWKERSREFAQMAAYLRPEFTRGTLTGDGPSVRVNIGMVGPGFFELLGTAPLAGRTFVPDDFKADVTTVVISHALWQQRFESDPWAIGRTIQLDGTRWKWSA
jgi:hypothetical protein